MGTAFERQRAAAELLGRRQVATVRVKDLMNPKRRILTINLSDFDASRYQLAEGEAARLEAERRALDS